MSALCLTPFRVHVDLQTYCATLDQKPPSVAEDDSDSIPAVHRRPIQYQGQNVPGISQTNQKPDRSISRKK